MRRSLATVALLSCLVIFATPAPSAERVEPAYRPSLGDLMTMTVQPRHIKLALAGRAQNWRYAAYELHQLREAFERVAHQWPVWRSVPIDYMINSITKAPMAALAKAIKDADAQRFAAAYGQLTDACNSCHQGANRPMIVIRVPDTAAFPDQNFLPAKPR